MVIATLLLVPQWVRALLSARMHALELHIQVLQAPARPAPFGAAWGSRDEDWETRVEARRRCRRLRLRLQLLRAMHVLMEEYCPAALAVGFLVQSCIRDGRCAGIGKDACLSEAPSCLARKACPPMQIYPLPLPCPLHMEPCPQLGTACSLRGVVGMAPGGEDN